MEDVNADQQDIDVSLYSEIFAGVSKIEVEKRSFFIKHIGYLDSLTISRKYQDKRKQLEKEGIPTREENLAFAIQNGWWSNKQEAHINLIKKTIENLKQTKKNLVIPSQADSIQKQIERNNQDLYKILIERSDVLGSDIDQIITKGIIEEIVIELLYNDEKLTTKTFNIDNSEDLNEDLLGELTDNYNSFEDKFNITIIRKMALQCYFGNMLSISTQPSEIFGKPISLLSKFQYELLLYGNFFRNIITNSTSEIPEYVRTNPDKLLEWNDMKAEQKEKLANIGGSGEGRSSGIFGANKDDLEKLGLKDGTADLLNKARSRGGSFGIHN